MSMNTKDWYDRSRECIAQGSLTNSKRPETDVLGVFPTHFERGYGAFLYVNESIRYLDFVSGLGAINLGYANEQVESEVATSVMRSGGCLSGNTKQEIVTAEKVKSIFHWTERVKFVNDGTEACMAAIRMARAFTGKNTIVWEGYHGWYDEATAWNSNAVGTPLGHRFISAQNFSIDLESFNRGYLSHDIAAIIIEPVMLDDSLERIEWLKKLREFCSRQKIVLIFDEVVTGMRYPSLSVAHHWNIHPDIICLGKACANGHKIGIVAGRKDILDGEYFVSGTYFGHIPTLKATEVTLHLSKHNSRYNVTDLNSTALVLKEKFNDIAPEIVRLEGWGARMNFVGTDLHLALFRQTLAENRIFTKNTFFLNHSSKNHIDELLMVSGYALNRIKSGNTILKGKMPVKPIAQIIREKKE